MINLEDEKWDVVFIGIRGTSAVDKYEYKIRSEEIKSLIAKGEYAEAAAIADTIDWRRVKSVMMLCTISDLYKINRRLEDAKDMLLLAYDRHPGGRSIVYSLCEISIKMGALVEALGYYTEFVQVAPKDSGRYVLKYKLFEAQEVTLEERIEVLEELKSKDYSEKWAYELAYLYHRVGLGTKCVEECDELVLWFGDGKYVRKALELKQLHEPLTSEQQEKYDRMKMPAEIAEEQEPADENDDTEDESYLLNAPTREIPQKELDIQVKVMNVGQYDTINMQRALAENMKEILEDAVPEAESEPLPEADPESGEQEPEISDTGMFDLPDAEDEEIEDEEELVENIEESIVTGETKVEEVFFGETDEIGEISSDTTGRRVLEEMKRETQEEVFVEVLVEAPDEVSAEEPEEVPGEMSEGAPNEVSVEVPAETPGEVAAQESSTTAPIINFFTGKPSKFDNMLGMEYDGQLNIVMPDSEQVEKQITGQLQLEDVLLEWEKMKKDSEQKRMEAVRQRVLEQTGSMFTEFDAAVKDGLLEQLENSNIDEEDSEEASGDLEVLEGEETAELLDESVDTEIEEGLEEIVEDAVTEEMETTEAEVTAEEADGESAEGVVELPSDVQEAETSEEVEAETESEEAEAAEEAAESEEAETAEEETAEEETASTEAEAAEEAASTEGKAAEEAASTEAEAAEEAASTEAEAAEEAARTEAENAEEKRESETAKTAEGDSGRPVGESGAEDTEDVVENSEKETEKTGEKSSKAEDKQSSKEKESETDKGSKVRELSEEEQKLFGSYTQNRKTREQIVHAIDNVSMAAYTGNVIITGGEGADTLTLAKNLIKEIQQTDSNFSGKIAKISGKALNRKEMGPILERLQNGALIVQNGGDLNEETVGKLRSALEQEHNGLVVLLEGTKKSVNKLLKANAGLTECFNIRIDIEELDNDSLVEYGKKYAREQEYSIDDFGMLALHTRIAERQTSDHAVTVGEVKELVDGAIARANRKTFNHFIDILVAKRYDEEDMIILREKDFM